MAMVRYILAIIFLFGCFLLQAQTADSVKKDSLMKDSIALQSANTIVKVPDSILNKKFIPFYKSIKTGQNSDMLLLKSGFEERLLNGKDFGFRKKGLLLIDEPHLHKNQDMVFYALLALVILLAVVMYFFDDYFISFLQSFTQPAHRLSFTNENLAQGYFPSFLLNLLFVVAGGIFFAVILRKDITNLSFWELVGVCAIILGCVYLLKFLIILLSGYLFNAGYAAKLYVQIVFTVNKFIGILLIPLLWVILFSSDINTDSLVKNLFSIFTVLLIILIIYRYFVSFVLIKNHLNSNLFHFFIYLCAVEILPVLILYKFLTEHIKNFV